MENTREEMLMKIYWKCWTSAEFESDFQRDWSAVFRKLFEGNHYSIPLTIIEMCFQYLQEWENDY